MISVRDPYLKRRESARVCAPLRLEEAIASGIDLACDVAICGVDNNPARVAAARYFRAMEISVIFTAVSRDGDHGFVFVQDKTGPCIACMFPDMINDDRYPCRLEVLKQARQLETAAPE